MIPYSLRIPYPDFNSQIVEDIVELEKLKSRRLDGSTHPALFFAIKEVFHLLESLGSARIEGNRTTIDELVEASITQQMSSTESLREIANIEDAMSFLENEFEKDPQRPIDKLLLGELHRLVVKNLRSPLDGGEGDESPGSYRILQVTIRGSQHHPPPSTQIDRLMDELVEFINERQGVRTDLLRIAIAHHRFVYIHPFRNGNGRTVRLLTYAMLLRAGFRVGNDRILNPTAVFCRDRDAYMNSLSVADTGDDASLLTWCGFMLSGLRTEISKIDTLLDAEHLFSLILVPTIKLAQQRNLIDNTEADVLKQIAKEQIVDVSAFRTFYPNTSPSSLSQTISRYKKRMLISPYPHEKSRKYVIDVLHGPLLRLLMESLDEAGFLPGNRDHLI